MEKSRIEEIAMAVAMVEYYQGIIDNAKEEIRNLTKEEKLKLKTQINSGNLLTIDYKTQTNTIYSNEYKNEVAKLKIKYPATKEHIDLYQIVLNATAYTASKREIITNKFAQLNKTQLISVSKNANIK